MSQSFIHQGVISKLPGLLELGIVTETEVAILYSSRCDFQVHTLGTGQNKPKTVSQSFIHQGVISKLSMNGLIKSIAKVSQSFIHQGVISKVMAWGRH